jgi:ABC-type Fe3+-hydroxamate transport system substrate-binding protein
MEGVASIDDSDTRLLITDNADAHDTNPLMQSPEWNNLQFVKNGHAHDLGATRLFGQILFAEDIANRVVNALTEGEHNNNNL